MLAKYKRILRNSGIDFNNVESVMGMWQNDDFDWKGGFLLQMRNGQYKYIHASLLENQDKFLTTVSDYTKLPSTDILNLDKSIKWRAYPRELNDFTQNWRKKMTFRERIEDIFDSVSEYVETPEEKTVKFAIERTEFTAEDLFKLSDLLGTGIIHIESETRHGGYCETCSYEYGVMVLEAVGVDF